jgi:putative ABC transport system substrate-binding protein
MRTPSVFEVVGPKTFSPLPQVPRYNALLPLPSKRRKSMKSSAKSSALFTIAIISALIGTWVEAQPTPKMPRIGFLVSGSGSSARIASFRTEFLKLGYVEGKNVTFETRAAKLNYDRLPTLADELVRLKVDVIVTPGANDTRAAKNATKTIPVVFLGTVSDPVSLGFVESLARPGGNVTGFTTIGSVLTGKRLELLKDVIPGLSRVALLWNPQNAGSAQVWQESQLASKELGLQLHSMAVNSADKFESAFEEAVKARSGAMTMTGGGLITSYQKLIVATAAKHRLPAIFVSTTAVANGGLMSYGLDEIEPYRRPAIMVDKILKGAKPAELPVEQPTKFELVINLKTAKQIGLTIPPNVLARADRVIR